jgi:hypothetical protein
MYTPCRSARVLELEGLPQYGLTLSGIPDDPVVENHSGRVVIGYDIKSADINGSPVLSINQILALSVLPAGIPDGESVYAMGNSPVSLPRAGLVRTMSPGGVRPLGRLSEPQYFPTGSLWGRLAGSV